MIRFDVNISFIGIGGRIMDGMVSGIGFSMASRAVDAVMGPRQVDMVHRTEEAPAAAAPMPMAQQPSSNVCQIQQEQLQQCLSQAGDMSNCNYYFDMLKQCQQGGRV